MKEEYMSNKKFHLFVLVLIVMALLLGGCGGTAAPAGNGGGTGSGGGSGNGSGNGGGDASGEGGGNNGGGSSAGLKITGLVDSQMTWTEGEVHAMETMDAISTNSSGEESTYTGVSINALLDEAGVQDSASTVVFVADDGTGAEASLEDVRGCNDCIVSFRNRGGFSIVMPGYPDDLQVKGVVEIKVQ
jgi:hypothetical protein